MGGMGDISISLTLIYRSSVCLILFINNVSDRFYYLLFFFFFLLSFGHFKKLSNL